MTQYQYRDAQTGEFVTQEYAEAHPDVTVREAVEGVVFQDTPDILALEARIQQLEEALERAGVEDCYCGYDLGMDGYRLNTDGLPVKPQPIIDMCVPCFANATVSAPTPDVSPLWRLLWYTVGLYEKGNSLPWGHPDVLWDGALQRWSASNNALSPDLRALIEARGGKA